MTPPDIDGEPIEASWDEATETVREPTARVGPGAPAGTQLVRARVLGALFDDQTIVGTFARFLVRERLGACGMGVVYEALDPALARVVAMKVVNVAAWDHEAAIDEAKALARPSHPIRTRSRSTMSVSSAITSTS